MSLTCRTLVATGALASLVPAAAADPRTPDGVPGADRAEPAAAPGAEAPELEAGAEDPRAAPGQEPTPYAGGHDEAAAEGDRAEEPGRGDFDAGGQVRLPNGPGEDGEYAAFNWIALDVQGRYFLLDSVTINADIPIAPIKPEALPDGTEPSIFGGVNVRLEAMMPRVPFQAEDTEAGLVLSGGYMREGAMLLSKRDYPLFSGGFEPGFAAGLLARVKLSSLVDFYTEPVFIQQSGAGGAARAIQAPVSVVIALGDLVKATADAGLFTGEGFSLRGSGGGRISAGGALTVKLGPIIAHAGAGVASLLTGGAYPTISDSFYVDLNVKYAN